MAVVSGLVSCNFPSIPTLKTPKFASISKPNSNQISFPMSQSQNRAKIRDGFVSKSRSVIRRTKTNFSEDDGSSPDDELEGPMKDLVDGDGTDWTTSVLLFLLWVALIFYVAVLAPDQTPSTDLYFVQKLLMLKGDDGFRMNQVLVSLWYMMGTWALIYSMVLLPSGRSSRSKVPLWPFLVLSFFGGCYVLIPYFVLWKPPPPPVKKEELQRWPLSILESKITAAVVAASGIGLVAYAGLASGEDWTEFFQYFRQSKFIHVMSIDFSLLSAFSTFWVYNDMTVRKWYDKGSWLLPLTLIPIVGPAIYLVLRPPISTVSSQASSSLQADED